MAFLRAIALSSIICGVFAQNRYQPDSFNSPGGNGGGAGGNGGENGDAVGQDGLGSLEEAIPGVPGDDYPIFAEVPETSFLCDGQADGGYYADPEAECQAFHICANDGNGGLTKYSFLCPNGTIFQQQYFVCDWWFNVDCSLAESLYTINDQNAAEREANSPAGASGSGSGGYDDGQGAEKKSKGGARGSAGGRRGSSNGVQGAASSPRGSYAAPGVSQSGGANLADSEYGAPASEGFAGQSTLNGYGRRRNA